MLTSLWQTVVGTGSDDETDNSKNRAHYHSSLSSSPERQSSSSHANRKNHSSSPQKISGVNTLLQQKNSEDDKLAYSLLSKFPPYGSHSALIRKHPHHNRHLIGAGGAAGAAAAAAIAISGSGSGSLSDGSPRRRNRANNNKVDAGGGRSRSLSANNRRNNNGGGDDDHYDDDYDDYDESGRNKGPEANKENSIFSNDDELELWRSTSQSTTASPARRSRRYRGLLKKEGRNRQRTDRDRTGNRGYNSNHNTQKDTNKSGQKNANTMGTKGYEVKEQGHPHPHPYNQNPPKPRRNIRRRRKNFGEAYSNWNEDLRKQWVTESGHSNTKTSEDSTIDNSKVTTNNSGSGTGNSASQSRSNTKQGANSHRTRDTSNVTLKSLSSSPNTKIKDENGSNSSDKDRQYFTFSFDDEERDNVYSSYDDSTSSTEDYYYGDEYSGDSDYSDYNDNGSYDDDSNRPPRFNRRQTLPNSILRLDKKDNPISNESNTTFTKGWQLQHRKNEERQHWMPDELCKTCYACEAQFNPFRRRHHCRLCGQIFCSKCSAFFVEMKDDHILTKGGGGEDGLGHGTIRTCKLCYDHVSESHKNSTGKGEGGGDHDSSLDHLQKQHDSKAWHKGDKKVSSPGASKVLENVASTSSFDSSAYDRNNDVTRSCNSSDSKEKVGIIAKTKTLSSSKRRFGRLAESAARENLVGDHGFNDDEVKLVGTGVSAPSEEEGEEVTDESSGAYRYTTISENPSTISATENNSKPFGSKGNEIAINGNDEHDDDEDRKQESAVNTKKKCAEMVKQANQQLGLCAASHLEKMGRELLISDAPLLLEENDLDKKDCVDVGSSKVFDDWVNSLMMLATRCCAKVIPNLRCGDMLDIRPYCKVKVIPGGRLEDTVYISGIAFHKNVCHKAMAKEISDPRIMLLSGGIEYTRTENKFASFDTLLEQESRYMEIIVNKIAKVKPNILMVGKSVNRRAQDLLVSRTNIVLLQHVKVGLMERIARQTGATILSSTNQIMNQFGSTVLGKCRRFRLVAFRNNEIWHDDTTTLTKIATKDPSNTQNIPTLLDQKDLPNHHRQAVLAASLLGESVHSAQDAVRIGIAKRGVTMTYGLIEGCPSHLGCTVVLRGASRPALKQVKRVFQFLINTAYNLKLETSYLRARRAMLPTPDYTIDPSKPTMSSSLCVDYGDPPVGRKTARPWNGGDKGELVHQSISGKITALDHQSILISSVWMAGKTQCCAEVKGICYYSQQDVSLGQFLRDSCFNLEVKCQNPSCKKSVLDHSQLFIHNDGLINITVEKLDKPIPPKETPTDSNSVSNANNNDGENDKKKMEGHSSIATWSYCQNCSKVVTPLNYLTEDTWKLSFGKFLEICFYNKEMRLNSPEHKCNCTMQSASTLYFGSGDLAARFTYERIKPYGVYLRRHLPSDEKFHKNFAFTELETISKAAKELFNKFNAKVTDVTRETRQLLGGESQHQHQQYLQTIEMELKTVSTEVRHASKILQEKIASVTNQFLASQKETSSSYGEGTRNKAQEAFMCFPWHSRRYLFLLASAWNSRLRAIGQALVAIKKLQSSTAQVYSSSSNNVRIGGEMGLGQTSGGDGEDDDVADAMERLWQLRDLFSNINVNDMSIQPKVKESLRYTSRSPQNSKANNMDGKELIGMNYNDLDDGSGVGGNVLSIEGEKTKFDFAEEVDADVLASRQRRHAQAIDDIRSRSRSRSRSRGRGENRNNQDNGYQSRRRSHPIPSRSQSPSPSRSMQVTAGGAVKSAITRFFNRGSKEQDPYLIDLGIFSDGRPKLEPGIDGIVVPVFDDQPSTIIAYSLSSVEYNAQFNHYVKSESINNLTSDTLRPSNNGRGSGEIDGAIEDFSTGLGGLESPHRLKHKNHHHTVPHKRGRSHHRSHTLPSSVSNSKRNGGPFDEKKSIERRMLVRNKTHINHTFYDHDEKGEEIAKFVCTTYWATQFQAVRHAFLKDSGTENASSLVGGARDAQNSRLVSERDRLTIEKSYNKSLSTSNSWATSGGKSGASFSKTSDDRFIVKCISRTELEMFLDVAPAYFKYVCKAFFQGLPTMLSKIVGVYQIGYHNRVTGKRTMEQVAVMQNIFFKRKISKVFDLKGTINRFAKRKSYKEKSEDQQNDDSPSVKDDINVKNSSSSDEDVTKNNVGKNDAKKGVRFSNSQSVHEQDNVVDDTEVDSTLLDGDLMEFTGGRPLPLNDRAKATFHMSIVNDTLFLKIINVLDYSILVGIDEERNELVVGIIDFMRQYDILKQMERVGKSIPMVVGSEAPTIIQPPLYKARFIAAMTRYFMTVPSKWTTI